MEAADRPLAELLAPVPGIDGAAGLRCTGGREALYRSVLRTYASVYAQGCPALLSAPSLQALGSMAHTIQGSSATVGAAQISALARRLELACRSAQDTAELSSLAAELHEHLQALGAALVARLGIRTEHAGP